MGYNTSSSEIERYPVEALVLIKPSSTNLSITAKCVDVGDTSLVINEELVPEGRPNMFHALEFAILGNDERFFPERRACHFWNFLGTAVPNYSSYVFRKGLNEQMDQKTNFHSCYTIFLAYVMPHINAFHKFKGLHWNSSYL